MFFIGEILLLLLFCLPLPPPPPTTQHHLARNKGSIIPVAETDFFYFSHRHPFSQKKRKGEKNFGGGEGEEINSAKSLSRYEEFCSSWRKSIHNAPFLKCIQGTCFPPYPPWRLRKFFFFSGEFGIKGSERLRRMKKLGTYTLPPQSFQSTLPPLSSLFLAPPPCMEFDIPPPNPRILPTHPFPYFPQAALH